MIRISLGTLLTTVSIGTGSLVDVVHLHYLVQESTSHHWHDHATSVSKTISNIGFNSKQHLKKIRDDDEVCSAENIVSENNNEVFRARLNPPMSAPGNNWSSMIQKNQYLHRNHVNFCSTSNDSAPDILVGGGLYANTDYYTPRELQWPYINPEDDLGTFKYYHFPQIKNIHAGQLDLTPNLVSDHSSTSVADKIDIKLFFTKLLNNLLNDWYWKTFQEELSSENIPDFANELSLVNQDWDFWGTHYSDLMQLEFGVEYHEQVPTPGKKSIFIGALAGSVLNPLIGWSIYKFFHRIGLSHKTVHQAHRFISYPLTMTFWIKLFNSLFATPGYYGYHPKGMLLDFINKYHELPSTLHLDNFDFYLPLTCFIVGEDQLDFHNASLQLSLHTTALR